MASNRFSYAPLTAGKHRVGITGDFSAWEILELEELGGVFQLSVDLQPGKYRYKLIVDGQWISDPANPLQEPDPFGGVNSVLLISEQAPELEWADILGLVQNKSVADFVKVFCYPEAELEFRFSWYRSLADRIFLHLAGERIELQRIGRTAIHEVHHCLVKGLPECDLSYFFELHYADCVLFIHAAGIDSDLQKVQPVELDSIPMFSIPDWVGKGVIYQIFPDRFCNGDPSNDPDFSEWFYADSKTPPASGEFLAPEREYFHRVDDWNDISGLKQSPWLPEGKPDWWSFYGGDIAGVKSKLDYLADLGIDIIYFNPLWQAKSNHKYDSADYHSIDPHFATTQEMMDFVKLTHQRGIKIILDVAFNHTGETFWAFRDCVEKGSASPYWNWYDWKKWPLPKPLPPDFKPKDYYQCWWGIKDMPDLNYDLKRPHPEENAIRNLKEALPNAALVDYLLSTVRWWLVEIGIDGFRLDVPDEVPYWFWELFRKEVKSAKPEAWIVGEIWHDAVQWVSPRYFDSVMNYSCFKNPVLDFFIHRQIGKAEFMEKIETGLALYPYRAVQVMMNLLGSHDTLRIWEVCKGNLPRLKLAILFQMCFIGTPHIYYGDEIAMGGGKDPDNRRPFNWNYPENPVACELRAYYKELIALRKAHPALSEGSFRFAKLIETLISFERWTETEKLCIVINPTDQAEKYELHGELIFGNCTGNAIAAFSGIVSVVQI